MLVLTLGCLAGVGWLIYGNQRAEMESERGERHTREVIQQFGDLLSSLKDAETGQRGFIITGKPDYLEPYQASLAEIAIGLADLRRLTADNPRQQQRLVAITPLVAAKLADLKETIALRETQGFPAVSAAVATQSDKKTMDEIRALVAQAQAQEAQLLKERVAIHAADNRRTMQSVTLGSALGGLALLLLFIRLRCELASRRQAQALVARQAAELATLYATAPVGLFFYDTDLRYVRVNPLMAELNGLPAELHVGRTLRDLLTPELANLVEPQVRQVLDTGRPLLNCEVHGATAPRVSEQQRHWLVSYHPVQAGDGTIRGVHGAVQEITEHKQAEQRLRQNHDTFFNLIENAPFGLYVVDAQFRLRQVSTASQKVFSNIDPLIGRDFEEVLRLVWADPFASEALGHFRHTLETGEPYAAPNTTEQRQNIPDIESYDWKIERILLPDGQFGVVCYFYDITERKQADEALRQSEERWRFLLDASELGAWELNLADHSAWRSLRHDQIFGYQQLLPAWTYENFVQHVLEDDRAEVDRCFKRAMAEHQDWSVECRIRRADGPVRWIWAHGQIIGEAVGRPARMFGLVADITERKEAEEALRQSEQRFRALVTASSDSMCRMTPDWSEMRLIYDTNFGAEAAVSNGHWLESYVHRDDQPRLMALIHEAIRTKGLFEMEHRVRRADGSWGWMLSRAVPLLDARGEIVEWFGAGSDVTEQKRAEQALRESERFLRSSLDALSGHIAVLDESGTILETNAAWQRFGHENHATASGTGVGVNYLQHCRQSLSQDDRTQAYARGIRDVIAGRQTHFEVEYPCHSPTEQRWFVMRVTRFQTPGPVRIVIVHDNCTERKLAEEALRESEERLLLAADAAHFGMYDRDLGGGYFHISTQIRQMLGYEPDAPLDHAQLMLHFHPDDQEAGLAAFQRACDPAGDGRIAIEQRIVRRDGVVRWISSVGRVLFEDGVPKRSIGFLVDITERNRLERKSLEQAEALADLDRRKDEFLAMLSHELRNPLAAISNAVHLLRLQKDEGPTQYQARGIIERQVGQLQHLVDDLLEVSRINTGRVRLRQEPVSVSGIVERAVETAEPLMAQRRHQLDVLLPPQAVFLHADAARLEQVLVNLLTNAAKYTDEGGHIWLSVEAADAAEAAANGAAAVPMVVIRVRDTGMGIAPELLPHIFDLFTQADRSLDRSQGGLGIGLCLVQRLVELHGGTVEAHSVLGQGSEFVVRLPVAQPTLRTVPTVSRPVLDTASPPAKASKGCRVLVVDDNVDAAQSLARLLEMTGHESRLAYDGPSALEAVRDYQPDVVLLDIGLPGLDGFEVAQRIRQQAALGKIVLVALTGYGQDADRRLSQDAGFDYHLVKPASFSQIEKILLSVSERMT